MKPACGSGTVEMTLLLEPVERRALGELVDAVGLRRVSIGPPISVIEAGWHGSSMRHVRGRRQHRHRRLADAHDVRVGADRRG